MTDERPARSETVTLDSLLDEAEATARRWFAEHPDADWTHDDTADAMTELAFATKVEDDGVLHRLALDARLWSYVHDHGAGSTRDSVRDAISGQVHDRMWAIMLEYREAASLDGIYQQAEANWNRWRAEHPDVLLKYREEDRYETGHTTHEATGSTFDAVRAAVPDDDAVLRRFAADEQVWLTRLDVPGQTPKHATQTAIEQIVGIRLDRKLESGELS